MRSTKSTWVLSSIAILTFVGIGGLQMYRVRAGWVTSYGADVLLPALLYFWLRQGKTLIWHLPLGRRPSFFLVLAGCFAWEWSQAYDFTGTPLVVASGTFDPADFAAYLIGLVAAVTVDAYLGSRERGHARHPRSRPAIEMVMPFEIREADPRDAAALSALAHRAKAHWGYSDEWLRIWSADLTISSEYLTAHRGFVAVAEGATVGVCVLESDGIEGALEHVWIAPESQRIGVGRALVSRALETASQAGAVRVSVLSDPFAEAFYLRLGARRIGSVPAPMPGSPERMLPRLEFALRVPVTG